METQLHSMCTTIRTLNPVLDDAFLHLICRLEANLLITQNSSIRPRSSRPASAEHFIYKKYKNTCYVDSMSIMPVQSN